LAKRSNYPTQKKACEVFHNGKARLVGEKMMVPVIPPKCLSVCCWEKKKTGHRRGIGTAVHHPAIIPLPELRGSHGGWCKDGGPKGGRRGCVDWRGLITSTQANQGWGMYWAKIEQCLRKRKGVARGSWFCTAIDQEGGIESQSSGLASSRDKAG